PPWRRVSELPVDQITRTCRTLKSVRPSLLAGAMFLAASHPEIARPEEPSSQISNRACQLRSHGAAEKALGQTSANDKVDTSRIRHPSTAPNNPQTADRQ